MWHHTAPAPVTNARVRSHIPHGASWHGVYPTTPVTDHTLARSWTARLPSRHGRSRAPGERMMPSLQRVAAARAPPASQVPRAASSMGLRGRPSPVASAGVTRGTPNRGPMPLQRPRTAQLHPRGWHAGAAHAPVGVAARPRRSASSGEASISDSSGSSSSSSGDDEAPPVRALPGSWHGRHVVAPGRGGRGVRALPPVVGPSGRRHAPARHASSTVGVTRETLPRGVSPVGAAQEPGILLASKPRRPVKSAAVDLTPLHGRREEWVCAPWRPRYGPLTAAVFSLVLALWIADRFVTNWWPRQTFRIGAGSAGSDQVDGYKPGPFTVVFYDVVARVSGRASIALLAALQFTSMHTLHAWLPTTPLARLVDFTDAAAANLRYHRRMGIALCVLTLVHVWSILGPCVVDDYEVRVVAGAFEWPLSERKPAGFKDVNAATETVMLQLDDVWRLGLMSLLLLVLMPLSVSALQRRYRLGIRLHTFIHLMYFADIARRHTHPHSWVINTPFFLLWLADKAWGRCRRHARLSTARPQQRVRAVLLDNDYMLLAWRSPWGADPATPAPRVHARVPGFSVEPRHAFSGYQNLCGAALPPPPLQLADPAWHGHVMPVVGDALVYNRAWQAALPVPDASGGGGGDREAHWTLGLVVRTYTAPHSHTRVMRRLTEGGGDPAQPPPVTLDVWGPTPSALSKALATALRSRRPPPRGTPVVAAVAGGSAAAFLLDALQLWDPVRSPPLLVVYSSRSITLFQWFVWAVHAVARVRGWVPGQPVPRLTVVAAATSKALRRVTGVPSSGWFRVVAGRADLASCLAPFLKHGGPSPRGCYDAWSGALPWAGAAGAPHVFFEGGGALQAYVARVARGVGARLHAGAPFDESAGGGGSGAALPASSKRVRVAAV